MTNDELLGLTLYSLQFCGPLVIGFKPSPTDDNPDIRNGSATLVRIAGRDRLITCQHVLNAYREKHDADKRVGLYFAGIELAPIIVDESSTCDLAVLDVNGIPFKRNDPDFPEYSVFVPEAWPADDAVVGDIVRISGWPEIDREVRPSGDLYFDKYRHLRAEVTGAFFSHFTCRVSRETWNERYPRDDYDRAREISGESGGPVFRERDGGTPELVGFVRSQTKEPSGDGDLIVVTSASNIRSDGTLKR